MTAPTQLQTLELQLQILQNQQAGLPLQAQQAANQFATREAQIATQIANLQAQLTAAQNAASASSSDN